ncbi:MAG: hypothetical protein R2940_04390 [Syntrophotaleaceae bacterium]
MLNSNSGFGKMITKAIMDPAFREEFLADPHGMADKLGLSEDDRKQLAQYDVSKLRLMVEGPSTRH